MKTSDLLLLGGLGLLAFMALKNSGAAAAKTTTTASKGTTGKMAPQIGTTVTKDEVRQQVQDYVDQHPGNDGLKDYVEEILIYV